MSDLDYDVRVKGVIKCQVDLDRKKQQIGRLSKPATMINVKFCYVNILRRYVKPPDAANDPMLLPDIQQLISRRSIHIPASDSLVDQELARRLQLEISSFIGIPEKTQAEIVEKVGSVAREKLLITKEVPVPVPGVEILILVGIAAVQWQGLEYREYEEIVRRAEMESMELVEAKPIPASKLSIEGLERLVFEELDYLRECMCTVCMGEIVAGIEAIRMPCSHIYHQDCIVRWLQCSNLCPLCRYQMPPEPEL